MSGKIQKRIDHSIVAIAERSFCAYGLYSLRHSWCADKEVLNIYYVDEILKCDHLKLVKPLSRPVGLFITL